MKSIIPHSESGGLIDFAYGFACTAHEGQVRKYTGAPYIEHPLSVARRVAAVTVDCEMIAAALLHDVLEDTYVTYDDLMKAGFGYGISKLVLELTDVSKPEDGNREVRKSIDREHLAGVSDRAKTIKLADLIDNTSSIVEHGKGFADIYMREKGLLLALALKGGDKTLYKEAEKIVDDYFGAQRS